MICYSRSYFSFFFCCCFMLRELIPGSACKESKQGEREKGTKKEITTITFREQSNRSLKSHFFFFFLNFASIASFVSQLETERPALCYFVFPTNKTTYITQLCLTAVHVQQKYFFEKRRQKQRVSSKSKGTYCMFDLNVFMYS